jgi:3-phosphoinositide dependent protein kinase-1
MTIFAFSAEVIDALEYLHGMGLIHRDIKVCVMRLTSYTSSIKTTTNHFFYCQPENLLLTADGHIKIADFGSVKTMNNCQITVLPTTSGSKAFHLAIRKLSKVLHIAFFYLVIAFCR